MGRGTVQAIRNLSALALVVLILSGCAAAGVPYTSDPAAKLADAAQLFDIQGRPLPAEKLIVEALDQYKDTNNQLGLAEAYINAEHCSQPHYHLAVAAPPLACVKHYVSDAKKYCQSDKAV